MVKLAADPSTPLRNETVAAVISDHMEEIDDIINSADFKRIKEGK